MRLGFYYHVPATSYNGTIRIPGPLGCFIDSLAVNCEKVICFLHTPNPTELGWMDYTIKSRNVSLINLGFRGSAINRTLFPFPYLTKIRKYSEEIDLLLIRGPSPLLPPIAKFVNIPTALLLVGDYVKGVDDLPQPCWRKELIRIWSHWNKWTQTQVAKKSLTFVNSHVIFEELSGQVVKLVETRTTTLSASDFFTRSDTCQSYPIRLLYSGRMDRSKGLLEITKALQILKTKGHDIIFDLVGMEEEGDPVLHDIFELVEGFHMSGKVVYHGFQPIGDLLNSYYKQSDLFIIASKSSEGFPRSIWEAMAHSLPVIATQVGSIPNYIEGAAELIPPKDIKAIAKAIDYLITHPARRQELIRRGFRLANENTLELRSREMVEVMKKYLLEGNSYEKEN